MVSAESQELARRGQELYAQRLKAILEPEHRGEIVAIEPDSGDYFLGKQVIDAIMACRKVHPDRLCHVIRIGYPVVYEMGCAVL